jgi:nucleotide-binding universal stress UspA family protein
MPAVTSRALAGRPATALVDEAIRLGASLIVVGNRRVQGVGRVLGSVATNVAAHAPCDVYIVKTV